LTKRLGMQELAGEVIPVGSAQHDLTVKLGWRVRDPELVRQALTHRSWCSEHPGDASNERLEFLGDAVLGLVVTDYLYRHYPVMAEGELAKARAAVVNSASLASLARQVGLGDALLLGKGEDASGGRTKGSILADTMEAVIGAMYLDVGYQEVEEAVLGLLESRLREATREPGEEDYKTRLQELCAQNYEEPPSYRVTDYGPDHAKVFEAEVVVGGRARGRGRGRSKKQAEQMAAQHAWLALVADDVTS
jgi:ribonuclease-3